MRPAHADVNYVLDIYYRLRHRNTTRMRARHDLKPEVVCYPMRDGESRSRRRMRAMPQRKDHSVKTTTIRLGDDMMELVEEVAARKKRPASEILRAAIRDYMQRLANEDDDVRKARDRIAERRITAQANATRHELGMEPAKNPTD